MIVTEVLTLTGKAVLSMLQVYLERSVQAQMASFAFTMKYGNLLSSLTHLSS